ncbi:MAG: type 1 glutamine amidotransferase [Methylophilaceae bacterium]
MKPVLIVRFVTYEGPGYLTTFLDEQNIAWKLVAIDAKDSLPKSIKDYSGMVLMGGPMSANDDLPWISPVIDLIRESHAAGMPLLGHCLGGQLISKALGAEVTKSAVKEIGWGQVSVTKNPIAKQWFGAIETFNAFHWHGETFGLPDGATHLLSSEFCENQAYAFGHHLVLQTHVEVMPSMVENWCEEGEKELTASAESPAVQQANEMQQELPLHCFFLNKVATQVYSHWVKNLVS